MSESRWAQAHQQMLADKGAELNERGWPLPKRSLPRIAAVAADEAPLSLRVRWREGGESRVDVSGPIGAFRVYEPLRRSPELFGRVRVGENGTDIVWSDEIDVSADMLWRLAREQAGFTMSPEAFKNWRERNALTLDAAAEALGVSRRMLAYYEQGEKPIPRVVALATRALESA
jgi:DNA-binding transcriptional regulator YiaG